MPRSCRLSRANGVVRPVSVEIITPLSRAGNAAAQRLVVVEVVVHDRLAAGRGQQPRAQADQAAGRDRELQVRHVAVRVHLHALGPAVADQLHHRARPSVGGTSITRYSIGSMRLAVDLLGDDARLADRQLVALAAHVLEQDAQVQQAAAGDVELVALAPRSGATRRATFDSSSFISRSRSCRLVT